jgi:hypothetical protein
MHLIRDRLLQQSRNVDLGMIVEPISLLSGNGQGYLGEFWRWHGNAVVQIGQNIFRRASSAASEHLAPILSCIMSK